MHDFGEVEDRPFIVTELVEGATLRVRLKAGRLAIRDAIEIGLQVTGALAAAHAQDLIHRDIKPENVMVRPDGYVKVLDFGLAKLARTAPAVDAASTWLTHPGQTAGTPAYMSPEQARAEAVDARTDVFSVGAVLYEMVTGRRAFPGESHAVIFAGILSQTPPAPTLLNPGVPSELERIISGRSRRTAAFDIRASPTCAPIFWACGESRRSASLAASRRATSDGGRTAPRAPLQRARHGRCLLPWPSCWASVPVTRSDGPTLQRHRVGPARCWPCSRSRI